jgi:alkylation response protein AidB-like acyl-CoA dehydrogenase
MTHVFSPIGAKYWLAGLKTNRVDLSPQLLANHGYRNEYSILPQYRAAAFSRLRAGTHEIMKVRIACSL